jgi:hypothetical protein
MHTKIGVSYSNNGISQTKKTPYFLNTVLNVHFNTGELTKLKTHIKIAS